MTRNKFFREGGQIVPFIKVLKVVTRFNGEIEVYNGTGDNDKIVTKDKQRLQEYLGWLDEDCINCRRRQEPRNREG